MRIIETVGAIDVEAVTGGVILSQEGMHGERGQSVFVPAALIDLVIKAMRAPEAE